jgi:hypothetical protein
MARRNGPMAPTSTIRWSKTAGAGGIGSMRREIRCWKDSKSQHERPRKACGLIRSRYRRGSGERGTGERSIPDRLFPHSLPSVMGFSPVFRLMLQRRNPVSRRGGTE